MDKNKRPPNSKQAQTVSANYSKMRTKYYLIFLTIIQFSCNMTTVENEKSNKDSLFDFNRNKLEQTYRELNSSCYAKYNDSTAKYYKVKQLFNCIPTEDSAKNPICSYKRLPFDTLIAKDKDTITYSFKVSNRCCLEYFGKYEAKTDTLALFYNFCGNPCDCPQDYRLIYKIPKKDFRKYVIFRTDRPIINNNWH